MDSKIFRFHLMIEFSIFLWGKIISPWSNLQNQFLSCLVSRWYCSISFNCFKQAFWAYPFSDKSTEKHKSYTWTILIESASNQQFCDFLCRKNFTWELIFFFWKYMHKAFKRHISIQYMELKKTLLYFICQKLPLPFLNENVNYTYMISKYLCYYM